LDSLRKQPIRFQKSAAIIGLLHIHFLAVPESPALMKLLSSNLKTLCKFFFKIILFFQKKKKTLTLRIKLEYQPLHKVHSLLFNSKCSGKTEPVKWSLQEHYRVIPTHCKPIAMIFLLSGHKNHGNNLNIKSDMLKQKPLYKFNTHLVHDHEIHVIISS
jgi:hypothetical protein